eukprot:Anaeramoba_ignava/a349955_261.p1 GENE.a349955_261~~a349955_261.p1  ORF type:complete len:218 (-),score=70.57 a349955_261:134-787(-)
MASINSINNNNSNKITEIDFIIKTPKNFANQFETLFKTKSKNQLFQTTLYSNYSFAKFKLNSGTYQIQNSPNAGGNSILSESMSFEILHRLFQAKLLFTEMEIEYKKTQKTSPMTDFIIEINKQIIGVSVTRAFQFKGKFKRKHAKRILQKKLKSVSRSTFNIKNPGFNRQILHIWTPKKKISKILENVYFEEIDEQTKSNTIVIITNSNDGNFLFV